MEENEAGGSNGRERSHAALRIFRSSWVFFGTKEDILPPTDGQWNWIDQYNIVLVNLGLWDNQPFDTEGYDEADIMIDNGIIPMMQGARYLVEKYYHPDPEKFYVSGWSVGGDLFTLMTTRPEWRGVIKGLIGTPGVAIVSGDPTSVPIAERGWVKYFNGCGTLDGAARYCEDAEIIRLQDHGTAVRFRNIWLVR